VRSVIYFPNSKAVSFCLVDCLLTSVKVCSACCYFNFENLMAWLVIVGDVNDVVFSSSVFQVMVVCSFNCCVC